MCYYVSALFSPMYSDTRICRIIISMVQTKNHTYMDFPMKNSVIHNVHSSIEKYWNAQNSTICWCLRDNGAAKWTFCSIMHTCKYILFLRLLFKQRVYIQIYHLSFRHIEAKVRRISRVLLLVRRECDNNKNIPSNMVQKLLTSDLQTLWYVCTYEQMLLNYACLKSWKRSFQRMHDK